MLGYDARLALSDAIVAGFVAIPPAEWVAVVLALGYLLLAVRQNAWCWACAIASSAIFLVLFARGGLILQAALQVFYIGMGGYGWWDLAARLARRIRAAGVPLDARPSRRGDRSRGSD